MSITLAGRAAQNVPASAAATPNSTSLNGPGNVFLTANAFGSGGTGTLYVAVADINGDGKLDYVTANQANNTIGVALGNGDGTFQAPIATSAAGNPVWVAVGDFNGDGHPDLAVVGTSGALVSILLGKGDGTFTAGATLTSPLVSPRSAVVGDFDGDGKLDLAVVDAGSTDTVYFFFGNGDGTFTAPVAVSLGTVNGAPNVAVAADFNKDGHLDLALTNINAAQVDVILGSSVSRHFQAPRIFPLPSGGWGLAVGDFNGDGVPDLVATTPANGGVSIFLGKGDGNFTPVNNPTSGTLPTANAFVPGGGPQSVAVGDFNKDGKLDIIAGLSGVNTAASVAVLMGNGDGTLQPELLFGVEDTPGSVAVGDFNGDGKLDWVAACSQINSASVGSVVLGLGRGDGTFLAARDYVTSQGPNWAATADFNKDGKLDVVVSNPPAQNISILLGNGDGTLQPAVNIPFPALSPSFVVTGDFNNDGNPDFVVFSNWCPNFVNAPLFTYLGNGDSTFQAPVTSNLSGLSSCAALSNMVVGDFNGDGKLDLALLLTTNTSPVIAIMLGNGDGTFQAPKLTSAPGSRATYMAVGDLNKDGKLDAVVVQYGSNAVQVFLGNGDGTFQAPTSLATGRLPGFAVLGDFNEDGKLDLIVDNQQDQNADLFLGIGDGTFLSPSIINLATNGQAPSIMVAGDFNLDGHLDFVLTHNDNAGVGITLMPGNGDGTFQTPQDYMISRFSYVVASADFNRDGAPNVLLVDNNEEFISILLNQTPPPLNVSPKGLAFSNQNVGTTSATQPVTVTNNGTAAATVSVAVSGDFAQANTCPVSPATLAASASCTISVSFTPTATGLRTGTITISDSLPGSPQVFPLTGTGVVPIVTLGGTSISFGNQLVGTSSPVQMVSLSNTGTGPLTISSIAITGANSGDFSQTSTCPLSPSTLAPQANCAISVTFKPTATGTRSAAVSITDNAAGSPQSVSLSGNGIAPMVGFGGTATLTFSRQPLGTSSAPQSVTLTNTGNAPLTISSIAITGANSGDFSQTNTCPLSPSTLAAQANCAISVTFKPTTTGTRNASVNVTDDAAGSPQSVSLTGTGTTVSGDFDGDGKADVAVFRPSNGVWYIIPSSTPTSFRLQQWGTQGDVPVRGDYDGDGKTDFAVWRPSNGTWYVIPSSNPSAPIIRQWGTQGDIPVPGDYDGDGKTDVAMFRPSNGTWFIIPSSNPSAPIVKQWGTQGDIPVPGDYDGDGKTDFAVFRPSNGTWYIIPSSNPSAPIVQEWGTQGDIPVPGDYDGDGKTDFAVWRPSNGTWYVIPSSNPSNFLVQQWGVSTDIPTPADYDGDRKTDFAVWRPSNGTWYVIPSSAPTNFTLTQWGTSTDVPVQKPVGQ